jgi:heat shock protein HslJ
MARGPSAGHRPLRAGLPAAAAVVALAACGGAAEGTRSATAGLPDLEQSLGASGWRLDPDDSTVPDAGAGAVTLVFGDGDLGSGSGPCTTYRGAVELTGDDGVRLGGLTTTSPGCRPTVAAAEQEYLGALEQVRTADVTDPDRLVLTSPGVRLSFTAVEPDR